MRRLHTYSREESGALRYGRTWDEDMGGPITVTGPAEALAGWPTPAMRRAVDGTGTPCAWYVGTDEAGNVVTARAGT